MSTRALAGIALLLGLVCAGAGLLLAHRLGHLEPPRRLAWTLDNPTLGVARGQRVIIRPMVEGAPWRRYTFLVTVAEPLPDDPVYPAPHLRAGVEELGEDGTWYRLSGADFVQPLALSQLGASSIHEWLEEVRPVIERRGTDERRLVLRALFGHENGSTVAYFFDPADPVPAFGWIRQEIHRDAEQPPEVHFAGAGGRVLVGEAEK